MSQQINLYNPIFLKQRRIFSAVTMLQALGVLALGLLAMWGFAQYQVGTLRAEVAQSERRLAQEQARLSQFSQQLAPRQKSAELEQQIAATEQQIARLKEALRLVRAGGVGATGGYSEYFRALARQVVPGLWLTGFAVSGGAMEINGRTLEAHSVAEFIQRLGSEQAMRGRSFATLEMRRPAPPDRADAPPPGYLEFALQSHLRERAE